MIFVMHQESVQCTTTFSSILIVYQILCFTFRNQISFILALMFGAYLHTKIGEDKNYSVTASVELKKLFPNKKVRVIANHSKLVFFTHVLLYSFLFDNSTFSHK
ncbi:hypothetical protein AAZV13_16G043600 [Glycine max]